MKKAKPCHRCGYDLRGIDSERCPECGTPCNAVPVRITDPVQFHRARAALEREKLLVRSMEPGGPMGTPAILEGFRADGWLFVDPHQLERVEACLDEAGVISHIGNLPIVDRSEPVCPKCAVALDREGPEKCPACAAAFQWVEIDEPLPDRSNANCKECGYALAGIESDLCPECGSDIAPTPDQLADAAVPSLAAKEEAKPQQFSARYFLKSTSIVIALVGAAGFVLVHQYQFHSPYPPFDIDMPLFILLGMGMIAMLYVIQQSFRQGSQ